MGGQERSIMGKSTSKGHGLFLCPTASMLWSFTGRNYVTTPQLRYGMITIDIPTSCNGCGKKFTVDQALLYHQWGDSTGAA